MVGDDLSLDVLRALADPTRHQLYQALRSASAPLTTRDLAERVRLHPNTVRAHLDHLGAVGLVQVHSGADGGRGRPRHRFTATGNFTATGGFTATGATRAPPPQPSPAEDLARALVAVAAAAGGSAELARSVGHATGRSRRPSLTASADGGPDAVDDVVEHQQQAGFRPMLEAVASDGWLLSFGSCPYRELAEEAPDLVCSLHEGTVAGLCEATGRLQLQRFAPSRDDGACHARLAEVHVAQASSARIRSDQAQGGPT